MLMLAAFPLLVLSAIAFAAALRLGFAGTLLAAYLAGSAEVVLIPELLGPFHAINPASYLVSEAVLAAAAVIAWRRVGSPIPAFPRVAAASVRRHPLLVVLGLAVVAALAFELFLAVTSVPNEWDALTYHLSRVAAWYQHGSLADFPSHTPRETIFPRVAELQALFTIEFTGTDRMTGLPQFVAELALLVGIFGTARRLGFPRPNAMFASLIFATLTQVALQATTAQNDLIVSAYLVGAVYFLLGRTRVEVVLAGLSLGLAFGTKFTAIYALPIIALLAFWALPRRRIAEFAVAAVVAFAVLGSITYVANTAKYGTPLGPTDVRKAFIPELTPAGTVSTASRILWRFVDVSGYNADIRVLVTLQNIGITTFDTLHIDPEKVSATQWTFYFRPNVRTNEDISWFGPLGALLLVPVAFGYAGAWLFRRTSAPMGLLALALPVFVLEFAFTYKYAPSMGRFMIAPVALGAALVARVYALRLVSGIFIAFGVVFLAFALVHSERKPVGLRGSTAVWNLDYASAQRLADPTDNRLQLIDAVVPQRARVGYLLDVEDFDYPLYGRRLQRQLVQLPAGDPLDAARRLGLDWVVIGRVRLPAARGWAGIQLPGGWRLVAPEGSASAARLAAYLAAHKPAPAA